MDYIIIKKETPKQLEIAVKEKLAEGWKLQGGVSTWGRYQYVSYSQAMVNYNEQ